MGIEELRGGLHSRPKRRFLRDLRSQTRDDETLLTLATGTRSEAPRHRRGGVRAGGASGSPNNRQPG